ncbi:MAG: response regulator [Firmicutes bacterium]|jgi:two-component system chemotaxis response regulator CheY|nr:response regulator [Bacillota bacterium]
MRRVLICDDSKVIRIKLKLILESSGYEVIGEAINGKDAVNKVMKDKPDIITMDITMPELNGIEAVKYIKEFDKDVKIVVISALSQKSMILSALSNGADNYIIKPFEKSDVVNVINKLGG